MVHTAHIPLSQKLTARQSQAATGALVGAAVGDALGGPVEFQPRGTYLRKFPKPVLGGRGEMTGGGSFGWAPGEFTDDTQMALALAESLLANGLQFDAATTWQHFTAWATTANDIGNTTRMALRGSNHETAAKEAHERLGQSGGNGSVMRIAPIGIAGVRWGAFQTIETARAQSDLTHFDEGAGWGAAIVAELIRRLILGHSFEESMADITDFVPEPHKEVYDALLSDAFTPFDDHRMGNGAVWMCIAHAVWAVRSTSTFEDAVVAAVNLGDDADTVAAVAGAIAGAMYGIQQIPSRWTAYLNGTVSQPDGSTKSYSTFDLQVIANRLVGKTIQPESDTERAVPPTKVHEAGVFATNVEGAAMAGTDKGIVSLCRTGDRFLNHPYRRQVYIIDNEREANPSLDYAVKEAVTAMDHFLAEGRDVVVHCFGGRSRTGLILKAWYMRHHNVDHNTAHDWLTDVWPLYATWNNSFWEYLDTTWAQHVETNGGK